MQYKKCVVIATVLYINSLSMMFLTKAIARATELLYGQSLHLVCAIVILSPHFDKQCHAADMMHSMKDFACSLQPIPTRVQQHQKMHMPQDPSKCTHILVKDGSVHPNPFPAYTAFY